MMDETSLGLWPMAS